MRIKRSIPYKSGRLATCDGLIDFLSPSTSNLNIFVKLEIVVEISFFENYDIGHLYFFTMGKYLEVVTLSQLEYLFWNPEL